MPESINVLLVDDSEPDAEFLLLHLRSAGLSQEAQRVETGQELKAALAAGGWDIVLSDFRMPTLNGMDFLRILAEDAPGLPCIIVSGQIGEEFAVEALKAGGKDFVIKSNLARLAPAILRELHESKLHQQGRPAEEDLHEMASQFQAISLAALDAILLMDHEGRISLDTLPGQGTTFGLYLPLGTP